jgi:hypothetical protein
LIEIIIFESGYSVGEDDLLDDVKDKTVRDNLVDLFEECVAKTPLHLGLARYLFRRATRLRTVVLVPTVFNNLTKLRSVFRDVMNYVVKPVLILKSFGQHFYQNGLPVPAPPEYRAYHRKTGIMLLLALIAWNNLNRLAAYAKKALGCENPQVGIVGDLPRPCARTLGKFSFG